MPTQINSSHILSAAETVARRAGRHLLRYFRKLKPSQISTKTSPHDFVTIADKASEAEILGFLARRFPEDAVLSEEAGGGKGPGRSWIVDPLDGTNNFVRGIPVFAVSIGVLWKGRPIVGVVFDPVAGEMFSAAKGRGAFLNGRRMHVSPKNSLQGALTGAAVPSRSRHRFPQHASLIRQVALRGCNIRSSGSLALTLASVAAGRLDGLCAFDQAPWDLAAGILLVTEAGGAVRSVKTSGGADIAASNGRIQSALVALMRAQRAL